MFINLKINLLLDLMNLKSHCGCLGRTRLKGLQGLTQPSGWYFVPLLGDFFNILASWSFIYHFCLYLVLESVCDVLHNCYILLPLLPVFPSMHVVLFNFPKFALLGSVHLISFVMFFIHLYPFFIITVSISWVIIITTLIHILFLFYLFWGEVIPCLNLLLPVDLIASAVHWIGWEQK